MVNLIVRLRHATFGDKATKGGRMNATETMKAILDHGLYAVG